MVLIEVITLNAFFLLRLLSVSLQSANKKFVKVKSFSCKSEESGNENDPKSQREKPKKRFGFDVNKN